MNFKSESERHDTLVRYLLDELSVEERDRVETVLLTDRRVQDDLAAAEEELADGYVNQRLLPEQREVLRRKFAEWPEWNERLRLARAMSQAEAAVFGDDWRNAHRIWPWLGDFFGSQRRALVIAVSAAVFCAVCFTVSFWGIHFAERGTPGSRVVPTVASFLLTPAGVKGSETRADNIIRLPGRDGHIELRLALDRDIYASYQVQLESPDKGVRTQLGTAVPIRGSGLTQVRVSVDASILSPGRYTIVLVAAESDGTVSDVAGYSFRVITTHN